METVLITGGSGLVGSHLTRLLLKEGYAVRHLGRQARPDATVPAFQWDLTKGLVDLRALEGVDHIIHLSGAGIADKRWTKKRMQVLRASRAGAAELLWHEVGRTGTWPTSFISASGVNYYGTVTSEHVFTEEEPSANDFLGRLCQAWEDAADAWSPRCRVVKLRTSVVLASEGGALPKLAAPARWGLASPLGSGKQWVPWVHIDDLARAYLHAIGHAGMQGAYNIAAPEQVGNRDLMHAVANAVKRPFMMPHVPALLLRTLLDGPAGMVLAGSRVSTGKIVDAGFHYGHPCLSPALKDLLG